jgi:hypothetical protein
MLSVIMLHVTYMPFVLIVVMLSVVRLNVIMLSVMEPKIGQYLPWLLCMTQHK